MTPSPASSSVQKTAAPKASGAAVEPDRVARIRRILGIIQGVKHDEAATKAVVDDERRNLEAFLKEGWKSGLEENVRALLK